jgi:hypothetical protein
MSNAIALYELTGNYWQAMEYLTHPQNDIPAQAIQDTLEGIEGEIKDKCINVAKAQKNIETTIQAIKQEETRMKQRRINLEKRLDWLKTYLKTNMEQASIDRIESPWFIISIRKNPESVAIKDLSKIPPAYKPQKTTETIDKKAILADLKQGKLIPGVVIERSTRVNIG